MLNGYVRPANIYLNFLYTLPLSSNPKFLAQHQTPRCACHVGLLSETFSAPLRALIDVTRVVPPSLTALELRYCLQFCSLRKDHVLLTLSRDGKFPS